MDAEESEMMHATPGPHHSPESAGEAAAINLAFSAVSRVVL
jgi:hypothetical protein